MGMVILDVLVLDTTLTQDMVVLATPTLVMAVDTDMAWEEFPPLESVLPMQSQRLRLSQKLKLMLSTVLMDMVELDTVLMLMLATLDMLVLDTTLTRDMVVLATPTLVMAVDTDMAVDLDIMAKYFQSIEDKNVIGLPKTNTLKQCTFSLKYILSAK